jgi:hypothetical protein
VITIASSPSMRTIGSRIDAIPGSAFCGMCHALPGAARTTAGM